MDSGRPALPAGGVTSCSNPVPCPSTRLFSCRPHGHSPTPSPPLRTLPPSLVLSPILRPPTSSVAPGPLPVSALFPPHPLTPCTRPYPLLRSHTSWTPLTTSSTCLVLTRRLCWRRGHRVTSLPHPYTPLSLNHPLEVKGQMQLTK